MSDMPSWVPPQAPTYTSNCAALSEAELEELVAREIGIKIGDYSAALGWLGDESHAMGLEWARAAIAALRKAGAMR